MRLVYMWVKSPFTLFHFSYSKTCEKQPLKIDKRVLTTTGRFMKVESIAEYSPWSILQ